MDPRKLRVSDYKNGLQRLLAKNKISPEHVRILKAHARLGYGSCWSIAGQARLKPLGIGTRYGCFARLIGREIDKSPQEAGKKRCWMELILEGYSRRGSYIMRPKFLSALKSLRIVP